MYCRKWHSDTNVIIVFQFQYYSKCLISMKTAVDLYCISFLISSHSHRNLWKVFFLLLKKKLRCRMTDPASCLNSILLPSSLIKASLLFFFFFKEWQWSCMDVRVGLWRKLSTEELLLLNCGVAEDSWESLGLQGDPTSPFWRRSALGFLWKEWC